MLPPMMASTTMASVLTSSETVVVMVVVVVVVVVVLPMLEGMSITAAMVVVMVVVVVVVAVVVPMAAVMLMPSSKARVPWAMALLAYWAHSACVTTLQASLNLHVYIIIQLHKSVYYIMYMALSRKKLF